MNIVLKFNKYAHDNIVIITHSDFSLYIKISKVALMMHMHNVRYALSKIMKNPTGICIQVTHNKLNLATNSFFFFNFKMSLVEIKSISTNFLQAGICFNEISIKTKISCIQYVKKGKST